MKNLTKSFVLFSASLLCSSLSYSHDAHVAQADMHRSCDSQQLMALSAVSEFNSVDGTWFIDGLFGGDGVNFQRNIMQRSPEEIREHRSAAIKHFEETFGIDITSSSIFFNGYEQMPEIGYKVILDSRKKGIRSDAIQVGGWIVFVVDPNGLTLGGQFNNLVVPQGTMFVYGDYKINIQHGRTEIISYKSNKPFIPQFDGAFIASFDVQGKFGSGKALATISPKVSDNGTMTANIKNVVQLNNNCN